MKNKYKQERRARRMENQNSQQRIAMLTNQLQFFANNSNNNGKATQAMNMFQNPMNLMMPYQMPNNMTTQVELSDDESIELPENLKNANEKPPE